MKRACIAVVDGSSAQLYTYHHLDHEEPELDEEVDLVNPGHAMWDDEFAAFTIGEVARLVEDRELDHVILVASPTMAAHLRSQDERLTRRGIVVDEIVRDLARLSSPQVHDQLAALDVIDPRARAPFARR